MEYIISYAKETWGCPVLFYTSPPFEDEKYPEMVSLLHEIADKWGITVIDMWSDESFNAITGEQHALYMADHIHHTWASKKPLLSTKTREVFSCILGEKRAKYSEIGLWGGQSTASEPGFFVFRPRKRRKTLVYFLSFFALQRKNKSV